MNRSWNTGRWPPRPHPSPLNRCPPGTLRMHRPLLLLTLTAMPFFSHAIEEPKYEVIRQIDSVELRQVPASQWAAIRYSGRWSQANYDEHLGKLQAALAAAGVATQGQPVLARYNGPMTPWFMRRNEVWVAPR